MTEQSNTEKIGVFKTVFLIYTILGLHLLLIAGLVLLVILFRGIFEYTIWILLGAVALIAFSAYRFWRRLKSQGRSLKDTLNNPAFRDRPVEISFMGGIANVKLGAPESSLDPDRALEPGDSAAHRLEDTETANRRRLSELNRLLKDGIITRDEFERAKQKLSDD